MDTEPLPRFGVFNYGLHRRMRTRVAFERILSRVRAVDPRERLVFPLDVPDLGAARRWVELLRNEVGIFKVGLELFVAAGPDAVRLIHDAGAECFLDLKLHDIPATMASATRAAAALGVRLLTVHASAGGAALRACAAEVEGSTTRLLAVTALTSHSEASWTEIGMAEPVAPSVERLARLAAESGVSGAVCSALEVASVRRRMGPSALLVVPGVRPAGTALGDQSRVATPAEALAQGADYLVVGRPIREAADPVAAARSIAGELS
jgi:orotidine-5'-phosphate decarboxylase